MPEGPEVYISAAYLNKKVRNLNFTKIYSNTKSVVHLPKISKIVDITSYGKLIIIKTNDYYVHIHFGITGWLVNKKPKIYKYILYFEDKVFYLQDRRRFSYIKIRDYNLHVKEINKYGVDILSKCFTLEYFINLAQKSNRNICAWLLDQKYFAGLGNYIKNEALYLSKISPFRKINTISIKNLELLYNMIKFVSFSNLVDWFNEYKIKIPDTIKCLLPEKLDVPYEFYVYDRLVDNYKNKIIYNKTHCGRRTFYVESLQK